MDAARNGLRFYRELQSEDGHWATEYGGKLVVTGRGPQADIAGPLFLTPGLIIALEAVGYKLQEEKKAELKRYLFNKLRPEMGWGL